MASWIQAHRRLLASARILKAYYESKLKMNLELLTEAPVPPLDGDVTFSESVTDYGIWGLRPSKPITREIQNEIATMCESILTGLENMEAKREALSKMQMHMERALNGELPSNVISMRRKTLSEVPRPKRSTVSGYVLRSDCLIEAADSEEIHRMAIEIHAHSNRSAFVHFNSLDARQRQSISQLLSLGTITLYVANVLELVPLEQEMFRHLLRENILERPLLMVGTQIPYSELNAQTKMDEALLTQLGRSYIKLTKPFSEYKEQGLIHYFLDSLSSDPT